MPLPQPSGRLYGDKGGRSSSGRWKPEERHVAPGDRRAHNPRPPSHAQPPKRQQYPPGGDANVEPRDGEEVREARVGKLLPTRGLKITSAAKDQRMYDRCTLTVEVGEPYGHAIAYHETEAGTATQ